MDLPNEPNVEQDSKVPGAIDIPPSVPTDNFVFQPSDSWLDTPMTQEFTATLDPDYVAQIEHYKPIIDRYAPGSLANFNTPFPGQSVNQYNPVSQQTAPDISTAEGALRDLQMTLDQGMSVDAMGTVKQRKIQDPIFASRKASQFDRYYEHPKFAELGFHPYANNEQFYNTNSDIFDDMSRMSGQFGQLVGSGFISTYRSIGDLFDQDESYFTQPDLQTADEFEEAMAIGMSTREGVGAFANNLLLNSGYTVGIIGSIALEELVLAGLTAVTGGAGSAALAAGTARNVGRLGQVVANSFKLPRLAKATRQMLQTLNQTDNARDFWKATKSGEWGIMGTLFAPETMAAVKSLKTGKNAAQNLTNLAKAQNVFGGFYRDLRAVNLAFAESKLEGGMVYNQQIQNGLAIQEAKGDLSPEALDRVREGADRAAFGTIMMNAPLIYFSNRLVLDNALGGFNKSLGRLMNDKITGVGRKIIQTTKTIGKDGKIARDVFDIAEDGLKGYLKRMKAAGVKGSLRLGAGASLRYFAANVAEGIQEIGQEAIGFGTKQYYSNLINDPMYGGAEMVGTAISSAVDSQFSEQGVETFLSGFLMGGVVQGPQKLLFQGMPNLYTRVATPEKYKEYKENKKKFYDSLKETHNKAWNAMAEDPNAVFDPNKLNFLVQKEVAAEMKRSAYADDQFGFMDAKDFGKFQQMFTIMQNGTSDLFRKQLQDYLNLTDEELVQAFPVSKNEVKSGKLRERIQDMITQIDKTEEAYNKNKDKFENPFDPQKFDKDSREYRDEQLKQIAYEHARYLYMFTEDGFNRALERADTIYNELASDPILSKIAANDITVLLDQDTLAKEVETLMLEIATLEDTGENKKLKEQKLEKLTKLQALYGILSDPENLTSKGVFDRRKINKVTKAFEAYVQYLADTKDGFVDRKRIQEVLKKIVDYKALKGRARVYDKAIQYLSNPKNLDDIVARQYEINKQIFKRNKSEYIERVKKYVNKNEANTLLNELVKLGVYPDAEQATEFLKTGDVRYLSIFFTEQGMVDPKFDRELYQQIVEKLDVYKQSTEVEEEQTAEEKEVSADTKKSTDKIDEVLENSGGYGPRSQTFGSTKKVNPVGKTLLQKLYLKYRTNQANLAKKAKNWSSWLNTKEAQVANRAYEALKQMWYAEIEGKYKTQKALDAAYKSDKGFIKWLALQETNPDVIDILEESGLAFSDFYNTSTSEEVADTVDAESFDGEVVEGNIPGSSYVIVKYSTVDETGNPVTYYQIKTRDNKDLSDEIVKTAGISPGATFPTLNKASKARAKLEEEAPAATTFDFDGVEGLYRGATVTDENGKEYVITSSAKSIQKYKNLSLIPADKVDLKGKERKEATIIVKPGKFKNNYELEKIGFEALPKNVSRLTLAEAVRAYGHQNRRGKANEESREDAGKRIDAIVETLTREELNQVELVITRNPNGGEVIQDEFAYEDQEANPLISRVVELYTIGLRISDPDIQKKVNKALKEKGIEKSDSSEGFFAYMPNSNVQIRNAEGKVIDPRQIDDQTAKNTFFSTLPVPNALSIIRDNFTIQKNLIRFVAEKLGDADSVTIPYSELEQSGNFSIVRNNGSFDLNSDPKSLKDLAYHTVDGNIIILDNRKFASKDGEVTRRTDIKTNIDDVDQEPTKEKLIEMLGESLYNKAINMGAYVAIIKSPNGQYTLAELKPTQATEEEAVGLFEELVQRAAQTRQENLSDPEDITSDRKDLSYNVEWNKDFKTRLYIKTKPGFDVQIQVDPSGKISLNVYDKNKEEPVLKHTKKSKGKEGKPAPIVFHHSAIETIVDSGDYAAALDNLFDTFNQQEAAKALGLKLEKSNISKSFEKQADVDTIIENTTTTLDDRVRFNYRLTLQQDSADIEAGRNVPDQVDESNKETKEEQKDNETLEEKIERMSQENEAASNEAAETEDPEVQNELSIKELKALKKARRLEIIEEQKNLPKDQRQKNLNKYIQNDPEIKRLTNLIANNSANKIVSPNLSFSDVEDINVFKSWAENALPDFISIDDITTLGDNLKAGGVRVGAFVLDLHDIAGNTTVKGTIYTGASNPFRYHEAFHSVFRLLLTDQEIDKYLGIARREVREKLRREGKNFKTELEKFRNSADTYTNMSEARLIQEYYEEYLADQFELFKTNPRATQTSSENKSLFTRILEWIRAVLGNYTKNELTELFENIDAGKYKSASTVINRFTDAAIQGVTIQANALLPYDEIKSDDGTSYKLYISAEAASSLVRSMSAIYIQREENNTDPNKTRDNLLDEVIEDFQKLYDWQDPMNEDLDPDQIDSMLNYESVFVGYRDALKRSLKKYLALVDISFDEQIYVAEQKEDNEGLRGVDDWDKDASLIGGFSSLSASLRRFIMSTTVAESDVFGHTEVKKGEKLIVPVNFNEAYNGLLKAVRSTTDPGALLRQMYLFGQNNPQTEAVVNRLFSAIGVTYEQILTEENWESGVKRPLFFNSVIKGLENFRVDYLFIHRDSGSGRIYTYSAANRDDANTQIDRWGQAYSRLYRDKLRVDGAFRTEAVNFLDRFYRQLGKNPKSMTDQKLDEEVRKLQTGFREYLGIQLSRQYLELHFINRLQNLTDNQTLRKKEFKDVVTLDQEDVSNMKAAVENNEYLFSTSDTGMQGVLKRISLSNAPFDETVGASVFKNANGDLVFAHQKPTLHLKKVAALNGVDKLEELREKEEIEGVRYLENNYLLNDPAFKEMSLERRLKVTRVSGSKVGKIEAGEDGIEEQGRSEGKTYGDFTAKEFAAALVNAYTNTFNATTGRLDGEITIINDEGKEEKVAVAPVLIRVIEASNTGDMMELPVIKAVELAKNGRVELTDKAMQAFVDNIKNEFKRIQTEISRNPADKRNIEDYYKTEEGKEVGRSVTFHENGTLLQPAKEIDVYSRSATFVTSATAIERLREGTQKALLYAEDTARDVIKFLDTDESRQAFIQEYKNEKNRIETVVNNLGKVKVTKENREAMIELLGDAISNEETDQYKYSYTLGTATYYLESRDLARFLEGRKSMYVYVLSDESFAGTKESEADQALEEVGLTPNNLRDYKTEIEEAIRENPELSFEEVIESLGGMESFEEFLRYRLDMEFKNFRDRAKSLMPESEYSKYITSGLTTKAGVSSGETALSAKRLNLVEGNLEHNLKQIFFNDFINTRAINQILLGDPSISLKDAVDAVKRAKMQNAAYDSAASIISAPEYGVEHPVQQMNLFGFTEPKVAATHNPGDVTKNADAQLWLTLKSFRYMWFGLGKLSATQAQLLDRIEKGEDIPYEELLGNADKSNESFAKVKAMLNSKKFVYGDGKVFVKMSAFTLTKSFTSRQDENGNWVPRANKLALHNLRVKMEQFEEAQWDNGNGVGTIAMAAPVSALKMMKENIQSIDSVLATDTPFTAEQSMQLDANFMGLQTVNPSNKLIITDPNQIKTIVTSEQKDDTEVILNDELTTIGKIRKKYNKAIRDRVSLRYATKRNLIFDFDVEYAMEALGRSKKSGKIEPDLYVYLQYARSALEASNSTSNILEMFSVDKNGQQKYNLNNPQTVKKFEQLFLSFFSKGVFAEKTTGMSVALVSDYGARVYRRVFSVDENGMPDKHEVIRENVWEQMSDKPDVVFNIDDGEKAQDDKNLTGLAAAIKKAGSKGVVIIDRLRSNLKEYDSKGKYTGQRYSEGMLPAHYTEVGDLIANSDRPIPDVVAKMFGVRIPSQDNHSTINIKLVDFLPGFYGSSGIFSRELIEISGADFDIDKLYIQSKNFYVKDDEFIEYGKAKTKNGQYQDYITAMNASVKKPGSDLTQALDRFRRFGGKRQFTKAQRDKLLKAGFTENALKALSATGLPITYAEYQDHKENYGEPYEEAIDNDVLDYKFALMGNEYVTNTPDAEVPISYEPADLKPLTETLKKLAEEVPYFKNIIDNEQMDVDNLLGKLLSFAANKEGAANIGSVVLPNLYLNLLQEYDVKIKHIKQGGQTITANLRLNDQTFNDFGVTKDDIGQYRTQYVISALITAMTDNAKERLAAKLGLNKNALSVVANMTALGVPIKTSILLVNHPIIRALYFQAINKEKKTSPGIATLVSDRMSDLIKAYPELEENIPQVNDDLLIQEIDKNRSLMTVETLTKAVKEEEEITKSDVAEEYAILKQFQIAHNIKEYTSNIGAILSLTKGLGQDLTSVDETHQQIENLGLYLDSKDYAIYEETRIKSQLPAIDVRPLMKDTWQGRFLEIFNEINDTVLPAVMLTRTPIFKQVYFNLLRNIDNYKAARDTRFKDKLRVDLLAYLTIKGYEHNMMEEDSKHAGSLNNSMIYPQLEGEKITNVVEKLRKEYPGNFFLESFVILNRARQEGNKIGIDAAEANTFNRMSDSDKMELQTSFAIIYGDPETRPEAMKLIHYMMVKDGLSYRSGSLLDAITPFTYEKFLNQINTVQKAVGKDSTAELFSGTFGMSLDELTREFIQGYMGHVSTKDNLATIRSGVKIYNPFQGKVEVQSKIYTPHQLERNENTLYIFGDNAAQNGLEGNKIARQYGNSFGIPYKKLLSDAEGTYYTDEDIDDYTVMLEETFDVLERLMNQYDTTVFPQYIIPKSELKNIEKNSPKVFKELKAALKVRFGYDLLGSKSKPKPAQKAKGYVYIDKSTDTSRLIMSVKPGMQPLVTDQRFARRRVSITGSDQKQRMKNEAKIDEAFSGLNGFGTRNVKLKLKDKDSYFKEFVVKEIIRVNIGSKDAPKYVYFRLAKFQSAVEPTPNMLPSANYAEYVEFDPEFSRGQWAGGFMFGESVSNKDIQKYIKENNDGLGTILDEDIDAALDNIDFDGDPSQNAASKNAADGIKSGLPVDYDGKNVNVGGKPADQVSDKDVDAAADQAADPERDPTPEEIDAGNAALASLLGNLGPSDETTYPELTSFWDENIQQDKDALDKLSNQGINNLEDFIDKFKNGIYANEEAYIDQIKKCII